MCIRWWSLCRDRPKFIESKVTEEVAYNVKDASLDLARFDPFRDFPSIRRKKTRPTGVCLEESGDQIWPIFERPYQQIVLQKLSKYLSTFRAISKKINYKLLWLLFCRSFWKNWATFYSNIWSHWAFDLAASSWRIVIYRRWADHIREVVVILDAGTGGRCPLHQRPLT